MARQHVNAVAPAPIAVALLLLALAAPGAAQERLLQPALAQAADYTPVYPTNTYPSGTRQVLAVFRLGENQSFKSVTAQLVAVDVGGVAPPNFHVSRAELRSRGAERGYFFADLPRPFPAGRYRWDVSGDGKPWQSAEFTVAATAGDAAAAMPAEAAMPLGDGRSWPYDFLLESGPGVHMTIDALKPDADGRYRGSFTARVVGHDAAGAHIEMPLALNPLQEWWQIGPKGVVLAQRNIQGQMFVMDPPQLILPWPPKPPQSWDWRAKDRTIKVHQTYRMWGPVPVEGPKGPAQGYVVLIREEDPDDHSLTTFERHFLPGFGVVREVVIVAQNGDRILRRELTLKK